MQTGCGVDDGRARFEGGEEAAWAQGGTSGGEGESRPGATWIGYACAVILSDVVGAVWVRESGAGEAERVGYARSCVRVVRATATHAKSRMQEAGGPTRWGVRTVEVRRESAARGRPRRKLVRKFKYSG